MYSTTIQVARENLPYLMLIPTLVVSVILRALAASIWKSETGDDESNPKFWYPSIVVVVLICGGVFLSFKNSLPVYKNEPVEATFIGYQPEINKSGKYVSHTLYAIFQVPEGQVVLPIQPGQPIASKVILYRN